ncbi:MAG: helix-turn-helix domain-containing protein [Ruminococcus sp.]|nr:helix-turn-helix domain-containing protein [Ruminococcus sp.]
MDNKIKRGQILRKLRLSRHMTQDESAKNFGISQQTYQKYESGKTEPPYDLLCDFAIFYGVTTDYLLGLESTSSVIEPMEALGIKKSVDDDEFMRLYSELPDYVKQIFVDTMAKLAQATEQTKPQIKKRCVKRLGEIEDELMQEEEKGKAKDVI